MDELNRCELRDRSVGAAMKTWLPCFFLSVVLMAAGCHSTADPSPDLSTQLPPPDSETTKWKPVTFIDKPELQTGTGAMDTDAATEFLSTDSGLRYRILRNSEGKKPSADSTVTVNYRGWLNTGKVFDSSYERGEPTTFPLQNVIDGWTEGMQLVGEGGMIELWVPSRLGYGERGSPGSIPAHSNLHFIVELVNVD